MFDAIKEALKKHMNKKSMSHQAHPEKEGSDLAPDVHGEPDADDKTGMPGQDMNEVGQPDMGDDFLKKIHQAILSHQSPIARKSLTLGERASDNLKEKMASIEKHKKA